MSIHALTGAGFGTVAPHEVNDAHARRARQHDADVCRLAQLVEACQLRIAHALERTPRDALGGELLRQSWLLWQGQPRGCRREH